MTGRKQRGLAEFVLQRFGINWHTCKSRDAFLNCLYEGRNPFTPRLCLETPVTISVCVNQKGKWTEDPIVTDRKCSTCRKARRQQVVSANTFPHWINEKDVGRIRETTKERYGQIWMWSMNTSKIPEHLSLIILYSYSNTPLGPEHTWMLVKQASCRQVSSQISKNTEVIKNKKNKKILISFISLSASRAQHTLRIDFGVWLPTLPE